MAKGDDHHTLKTDVQVQAMYHQKLYKIMVSTTALLGSNKVYRERQCKPQRAMLVPEFPCQSSSP